ncbi:MAG: AAA family ATPase [Lachnospiraceae bacterium]|nr:AAA family ATPase [Lachnospiraceae bacterium]
MKPGKEIKPLTNLKEATRFMDAGLQKSKLNLNEIPCIAVIEENKVPTMEEVPCIAVIEDNSVPTMEEVPYVGVEDKPEYLNVIIGQPEEPAEPEKPVAVETPVVPITPVAETPVAPVAPVAETPVAPVVSVAETPVMPAPAASVVETPAAPATPVEDETPFASVAPAVESPVVPITPAVETPAKAAEIPARQESPKPAVTPVTPLRPNTPLIPFASFKQTTNAVQEAPAKTSVTPTASAPAVSPVTPTASAPAVSPVAPAVSAPAATSVTPVASSPVATPVIQAATPFVTPAAPVAPAPVVTPVAPVSNAPKISGTEKNNIRKIISDAITLNKQVIFVGPSGTGKTYEVRKYARRMTKGYDGFKFVQFHQSYEYSDFIEGLRPVNIVNSTTPTNVRLDGIFKAFCRKIVEDNLNYAVPGFMSMYSEKKQKVVQRLYESIRDRKEAIDDGSANEFFGPETEEYKFEKGTRDYYLIIDEVNRADVSKVFGDVLFALDEDYRGIENRFDTRLSNLKAYHIVQADEIGKANYNTSHIGFAEQMKFDCFENGFFIPKNLHIVCTMNEVDNDASTMDFAFKHKFNWVNINTEDIMLTSLKDIHKDKSIFWLDKLAENVNRVNRLISDGISPEHRIGPAFFKNLNESSYSIDVVFDNTIEPILKEYLKGKPEDITERFISECKKALKLGI